MLEPMSILAPGLTVAFQDSVPGVLGAEGAATGEGQPLGPAGAAPPAASPFGGFFLPFILLMVVLMVFTTFSSGRRQKREKQALMSSLGRQDKVQTVGGVIGTIVEIDSDSVILRVDETTNTRIRFAKTAIQSVLRSGGKAAGTPETEADKSAA